MDFKKKIKNNTILQVSFDGKYKKKNKKIEQDIKFFLIGVLPLVVEYADGKKQRCALNTAVEVEQDPYLRLLNGSKARDIKQVVKMMDKKFKRRKKIDYSKITDEVVEKCYNTFMKAVDTGVWNKKKIKSILIINIGDLTHGKVKNNK